MKSVCRYCNNEFEYRPSQSTGKYCRNKCQQQYQRKKKFDFGLMVCAVSQRKMLAEVRTYVCELCDNDGTHNHKSLTLQVDHIDGNSDNNDPGNLRLVCPNCHSQLPTSIGGIGNKKYCSRNKIMHRRSLSSAR